MYFIKHRMYDAQQWYLDRFGFPKKFNGVFFMMSGLSHDVTAFRRFRDMVSPDTRAACAHRFMTFVLHSGDITILQTEFDADTVKSWASGVVLKHAPPKRRNYRWVVAFCRRHCIPLHVQPPAPSRRHQRMFRGLRERRVRMRLVGFAVLAVILRRVFDRFVFASELDMRLARRRVAKKLWLGVT